MIRDMIYDGLKKLQMKGLPNRLVWCDKPPQEVAATQRFVSTWPQIWFTSVEIFIDCSKASAPLCASHPRPPILILLFPAIVLSIATIFGDIFGGFNNDFNVFVNEFEWEKSGLSGSLSSPQIPHTQTQQHPATPEITSNDTTCPTCVGLRDFNINGYVFDVVLNEYEFNNETNNIFDIYFNENYYGNAYYYATPGICIFNIFIFFFVLVLLFEFVNFCKFEVFCFLFFLFYVRSIINTCTKLLVRKKQKEKIVVQ